MSIVLCFMLLVVLVCLPLIVPIALSLLCLTFACIVGLIEGIINLFNIGPIGEAGTTAILIAIIVVACLAVAL